MRALPSVPIMEMATLAYCKLCAKLAPKTLSAPGCRALELLALGLMWEPLPGGEALLVNFDHQLLNDCLEGAADESESVIGRRGRRLRPRVRRWNLACSCGIGSSGQLERRDEEENRLKGSSPT
jgi:hypothetical protein